MSPSLYFKDQHKKYLLVVRKDLYRGIVNPYFLELQQKYVVDEENCPYGTFGTYMAYILYMNEIVSMSQFDMILVRF